MHYLLLVYISILQDVGHSSSGDGLQNDWNSPSFPFNLKVKSVFLVHSLGGGWVGSSTCWIDMSLFDLMSPVRNVCAAGTEGTREGYVYAFWVAVISPIHTSTTVELGLGSKTSIAEDERELSARLRLLPSLDWQW